MGGDLTTQAQIVGERAVHVVSTITAHAPVHAVLKFGAGDEHLAKALQTGRPIKRLKGHGLSGDLRQDKESEDEA